MSGRILTALAVSLALAVAGAVGLLLQGRAESGFSAPSPGAYRGSEPPGVNRLPRFTLPRIGGGIVRSVDLGGRVVLTTFVDSDCKETCPIIIGILGRALPQLSLREHRQVSALAMSVNPAGDTGAHVRRFLAERGALGQLDYLVAPVAKMKRVWKHFHVLSAAESGNPNLHSADVRIFDRRGRWVSTLNAGADLSVANLLHDIRQALKGGS
jgi:cytochrome oxidase Cu insertion factor (SCO1/SenC/PrrC family)